MKAVDVMRWQLLFETSQQQIRFDLHWAVCRSDVFHWWSLTAHFTRSYELIEKWKEPEESHLSSSTYSPLKECITQATQAPFLRAV